MMVAPRQIALKDVSPFIRDVLPPNKLVGVVGDSRSANNWNNVGVFSNCGYLYWAQALTSAGFDATFNTNFATAGYTTTQILNAFFPTAANGGAPARNVLTSGCGTIVLLAGTNDDYTFDSIGNLNKMVQALLDANIFVILIAEMPRGNANNTSNRKSGRNLPHHTAIRQWCLEQATRDRRLFVVDPWPKMADPYSLTGDIKTGLTTDELHPSPVGALLLGQLLAPIFNFLFPSRPLLPATNGDQYDATDFPHGLLTSNPMMDPSLKGGTKTTSAATGDVATGYTLICTTGGLTAAASLITDADGTSWQRIVVSGTPTDSNAVQFLTDVTLTKVSPGDVVQSVNQFRIGAGAVGCAALPLVTRVIGSTNTLEYIGAAQQQTNTDMPSSTGGITITPPMVLQGGLTTVRTAQRFMPRVGVAMNITADFRAMGMRKVL